MPEKLLIVLGLTVLGVGGTIFIFFLFRACIRKATLSKRNFVSILHLILLAIPTALYFLQDLKILPLGWPNFLFWAIGVVCSLLSLGFNVRLWGWGYGFAFTLCEIFSSLALTMLLLSAAYGIIVMSILVLATVVAFISMHGSSRWVRVSDSPFGTDFFYAMPMDYGGFVDGEGNYYSSMSDGRLLGADGSIYYIVD